MMELSVKFFEGAPMVPLGELIVECDYRNDKGLYNLSNLRGISIEKKFIGTKANMDGVSLLPYKIVEPTWISFVTVTSRNGEKISLAYNDSDVPYIVSSSYVVIRVNDSKKLDPLYLFLMLQRREFDRLARFNSWGSARETYSFDDLTRYRIPLPSIDVQRQYVAAYKSLQQLAEQNEALTEPLEQACMAFMSNVVANYARVELRDYIIPRDERNSDLGIKLSQGISNLKYFQEPKQTAVNSRSDKIVRTGQFAYNRATTRNGEKISIAYREGPDCTVSSAYQIFELKNENDFLPHFLMLWFRRSEFDRYARYMSKGSAHEFFEYEDMCQVRIPKPPIEVQKAVIAILSCAEEARAIAREAREQLKKLAPAMVQRAANTPIEV